MSGARPRIPGGYFDAPRYLFDAIVAAPDLSCAQLRLAFTILRLTWGYYPEKNRDGAEMKRRHLAEITGLSKRTVDNVLPPLVKAGMVQEMQPYAGRRGAVLRINPHPEMWGRFEPVGYSSVSSQDDEDDARAVECDPKSTHGARPSVPMAHDHQYSTASPSPSSLSPSSLSPSSPPKPPTTPAAEERVVGGFADPRLREATQRFLNHAKEPLK